jgi:hypothetical protein
MENQWAHNIDTSYVSKDIFSHTQHHITWCCWPAASYLKLINKFRHEKLDHCVWTCLVAFNGIGQVLRGRNERLSMINVFV